MARTSGCALSGFVLVKKVPGTLHFLAKSAAHSFDHGAMNMSHVVNYWRAPAGPVPRARARRSAARALGRPVADTDAALAGDGRPAANSRTTSPCAQRARLWAAWRRALARACAAARPAAPAAAAEGRAPRPPRRYAGNKPSPHWHRELQKLHPAGLTADWADKLADAQFFSHNAKAAFEHYLQARHGVGQGRVGLPHGHSGLDHASSCGLAPPRRVSSMAGWAAARCSASCSLPRPPASPAAAQRDVTRDAAGAGGADHADDRGAGQASQGDLVRRVRVHRAQPHVQQLRHPVCEGALQRGTPRLASWGTRAARRHHTQPISTSCLHTPHASFFRNSILATSV